MKQVLLYARRTSSRLAMTLGSLTLTGFGLAVVLSMLLGAHGPLDAQTVSGTVTGTITDASDAVVPGVNIRATNTATNEVRNAVSNTAGLFSIPALSPGPYVVDVIGKGFAEDSSSVNLSVGQVLNINFKLKIGSATEKVEVVANESLGRRRRTTNCKR